MPLRKDVTKTRFLWVYEAAKEIDLFLVKTACIPVNQRADIIRRTQRWILAKAESHCDGFDKEDLSAERVKNKVSNPLSYLIRRKWERDDSLGGERDDDDGDDVFEVTEADANPVEEEDQLRPLTHRRKERTVLPSLSIFLHLHFLSRNQSRLHPLRVHPPRVPLHLPKWSLLLFLVNPGETSNVSMSLSIAPSDGHPRSRTG